MDLPAARGLPLLLLAAALALGWNIGGYRLLDPDEGRNAEVAREMFRGHDYLVPHLDGLPYLDKPVVYFAAAATVMTALGPTETAARLPAYLATLGTIGLVAWFARRRWGAAAGWLAGIACATMPLTLMYAHTAIFDSTLTFCTTAAIILLFEEHPSPAWAAIGVGALTKGPVAIAVPLVVMLACRLAVGLPVRRLVSWGGLVAFAIVSLPWFLAVSHRFPEFPSYVFVRETFQRFTTPSFHRNAPFWYYLPIVAVGAFPWIVPAAAGLGRWRMTWASRRDPGAREPIWLAAWVLAPLALLTLNHSKLPQYVLPLMPAFALAAARHLAAGGPRAAWRPYIALALGLAAVLFVLPGRLLTPLPLTDPERLAIPQAATGAGVALLVSAASLAIAAWRAAPSLAGLAYGIPVMSLPFVSAGVLRAVGDDRSAARLATAIQTVMEHARSGNPVAVLGVGAYPPSLPFYLDRTIDIATADAGELTSNYIAAFHDRYREIPGSPLRPADAWRGAKAHCTTPTVFIVRSGDRAVRDELDLLPFIFDSGRYAAYGPCTTQAVR